MADATIAICPLTPDRWPDLTDLFGPHRGANGGCWCLWPRVGGAAYLAMTREQRREAFGAIVAAGPPPGLLAYADALPVGWCAIGPRPDFARFQNAKTSRLPEAPDTPGVGRIYAITCFYVRTGYRRRGLVRRLTAAAIDHARRSGATALDVCAIEPNRALSWGEGFVGIASVFPPFGFREIARRSANRPLLRLDLADV